MRFEEAVSFILSLEGGYSNDPTDPGGETQFGISHRAYPDLDIKKLTRDEAIAIYKQDYWDHCHCDELPSSLRLSVFDGAVNQGQPQAIKMLQGLVGVPKDGLMGPVTIKAVQKYHPPLLKTAFLIERVLQYIKNPQFQSKGRGWLHRIFRVHGA